MNNKHQSEQLTLFTPKGFPLVKAKDQLATMLLENLAQNNLSLQQGDVLVLAQKIVSKAENRLRKLSEVKVSQEAKELAEKCDKDSRIVELILQESKSIVRSIPGLIIAEHKQGFISANAGIDQSNVESEDGEETVLLLPEDVNQSARDIREHIRKMLHIDVAVIINDSFGRPWRLGSVGVALGSSGIKALVDMRKQNDLFGRELQVTEVAIADEIAAAASLLMGQASEGQPVVLIRGLKYQDSEQDTCTSLIRKKEQDLFR